MNPENPYDLQDAADSYLETKSSDELIAELKKVLYVSKVQKEHEILYGQDWQRVYTTNYDEVPILASNDIVNIGLHFILKNVRPYAAPCSEA